MLTSPANTRHSKPNGKLFLDPLDKRLFPTFVDSLALYDNNSLLDLVACTSNRPNLINAIYVHYSLHALYKLEYLLIADERGKNAARPSRKRKKTHQATNKEGTKTATTRQSRKEEQGRNTRTITERDAKTSHKRQRREGRMVGGQTEQVKNCLHGTRDKGRTSETHTAK